MTSKPTEESSRKLTMYLKQTRVLREEAQAETQQVDTYHVQGSPWNSVARYMFAKWMTSEPRPCFEVS